MFRSEVKKIMFAMVIAVLPLAPWTASAAQAASSSASQEPQNQSSLSSESSKEVTYLMCQNGANVRTIRFLPSKTGGCKTAYTKEGGTEQIVAESWNNSRCFSVMNNIRENLTNANWKCRDISDSRISSSLTD